MAQRKRLLLGVGIAFAVGVTLVVWGALRERMHADPLKNVPTSVRAVMWAKPVAVLDSPFLRAWTGVFGGDVSMAKVKELCGTNPLDSFERVTVFLGTEDGDRVGDFGYIAEGSIDRRSLVDCVRKLLEADGSGVRRVDVDGHPGVAGMSGDSRAIFFGKRAVVGGTEALVRSVLDAVAHADHAAAGATDLEALRAVVTPESDVVVLLRVPERWRKVVRTGAVLRFGVGFADLGAMELVGLALAFHDGLSLRMRAGFANDGQAKSLAEAARRGMDLVRKSDAVAVSVAAPVLARTRVSAEGRFVTLETAADASEIEPLLRLVQKGMAPAPPVDAAGGADRNASEPSNPR